MVKDSPQRQVLPKIPTWSDESNIAVHVEQASPEERQKLEGLTTVMIRGISNQCSHRALERELIRLGFTDVYDFVHVPLDTRTRRSRGFAFVNFIDEQVALRFFDAVHKQVFADSPQAVVVQPAVVQGYEANYQHFWASPLRTRVVPVRPLFLPRRKDSNTSGLIRSVSFSSRSPTSSHDRNREDNMTASSSPDIKSPQQALVDRPASVQLSDEDFERCRPMPPWPSFSHRHSDSSQNREDSTTIPSSSTEASVARIPPTHWNHADSELSPPMPMFSCHNLNMYVHNSRPASSSQGQEGDRNIEHISGDERYDLFEDALSYASDMPETSRGSCKWAPYSSQARSVFIGQASNAFLHEVGPPDRTLRWDATTSSAQDGVHFHDRMFHPLRSDAPHAVLNTLPPAQADFLPQMFHPLRSDAPHAVLNTLPPAQADFLPQMLHPLRSDAAWAESEATHPPQCRLQAARWC